MTGKTKKVLKNSKNQSCKSKNSKNQSCKSKNMTVCCPHMPPTNGKYSATTRRHKLKYINKHYYFKTCCDACASSMKHMAFSNPVLFKKLYIANVNNNFLLLKNRHTQKTVQKAPLVKK